MKRSIVILAALLLASGVASASGQNETATVAVEWGDEIIDVDPTLCDIPIQALIVTRNQFESITKPTRVLLGPVILAPDREGVWQVVSDDRLVPVKGSAQEVQVGDVLCLTPATEVTE